MEEHKPQRKVSSWLIPVIVAVVVALIIGGVLWRNHTQDQRNTHDFYCAISHDKNGFYPPGCP